MSSTTEFLASIQASPGGLGLGDLLARHPDIPRRTAQRLISRMIDQGLITANGEGRARRYLAASAPKVLAPMAEAETFPDFIPVSADSRDIVAYIGLPLQARKPVGYQRKFLEDYRPNETWYLAEPLRRQLHKTGRTPQIEAAAGTYSRAILNRLLIDLSWASSHLEGNTYSRLDTRQLIEHDAMDVIQGAVKNKVPGPERNAVQALIIEELCRLHEGVLARYGLRPSQFEAWKKKQG